MLLLMMLKSLFSFHSSLHYICIVMCAHRRRDMGSGIWPLPTSAAERERLSHTFFSLFSFFVEVMAAVKSKHRKAGRGGGRKLETRSKPTLSLSLN